MRRKGRHGHAFLLGQLVSVVGWGFRDPGLRSAAFKAEVTAVGIVMETGLRHEHAHGAVSVHVLVEDRLGWFPENGLIDVHALGDDP